MPKSLSRASQGRPLRGTLCLITKSRTSWCGVQASALRRAKPAETPTSYRIGPEPLYSASTSQQPQRFRAEAGTSRGENARPAWLSMFSEAHGLRRRHVLSRVSAVLTDASASRRTDRDHRLGPASAQVPNHEVSVGVAAALGVSRGIRLLTLHGVFQFDPLRQPLNRLERASGSAVVLGSSFLPMLAVCAAARSPCRSTALSRRCHVRSATRPAGAPTGGFLVG
jgi:hypothetical protein